MSRHPCEHRTFPLIDTVYIRVPGELGIFLLSPYSPLSSFALHVYPTELLATCTLKHRSFALEFIETGYYLSSSVSLNRFCVRVINCNCVSNSRSGSSKLLVVYLCVQLPFVPLQSVGVSTVLHSFPPFRRSCVN